MGDYAEHARDNFANKGPATNVGKGKKKEVVFLFLLLEFLLLQIRHHHKHQNPLLLPQFLTINVFLVH